jgi:uncharacterized membrane protein YhiD involved in acid resistance
VSPLDLSQVVSFDAADIPKLSELFVRMSVATLLGGLVAFRGWHYLFRFVSRPSLQTAQAQALIATAGAVMVVVIGDHPARAFGLVGLGSFIRFRSGISDPRDAAVMFVMIGIGMACGLGLFAMAIGSTLFIALVLTLFDATRNRATSTTRVTINADDASYVRTCVQSIFPGVRILEAATNAPELGKDCGKLVVELELKHGVDASTLSEKLNAQGVRGVRRVALWVEE